MSVRQCLQLGMILDLGDPLLAGGGLLTHVLDLGTQLLQCSLVWFAAGLGDSLSGNVCGLQSSLRVGQLLLQLRELSDQLVVAAQLTDQPV